MNINKTKKIISLISVASLTAATICGTSLLSHSNGSNSLVLNQNNMNQTQLVRNGVARNTAGVKSITISKTNPFAPNNGYIEGDEVTLKLEINMDDPNELPPDVTAITWTCTASDGRILDERNGTIVFVIDSFSSMYQNSTITISKLAIDGIEPTDTILNVDPVTLGKAYNVTVSELDYISEVKIISIVSALAFIIVLATIIGKIGITYKMEHSRSH